MTITNDEALLSAHGISLWDADTIKQFRHALLAWYDIHRRDLPWRRTHDPYAIWVSEVMLQQTQVATVIPYYQRFMAQFPTIAALAAAPEAQLLKAWEGLGYYSRARNLQKGAQQVMTDFASTMPQEASQLRTIKGIGPYTAGAIASIAFNACEPAVDGNVMRVMSRLFEIELDIAVPKNRQVFEALVRCLIDPQRPGDFNQALMDLGSDICSAHNPRPQDSPIKAFNAAYRNNTMERYPIKSKKAPVVQEHFVAWLLRDADGRLAFVQRPDSGLLAQLWTVPLHQQSPDTKQPQLWPADWHWCHATSAARYLGTVQHRFTHRKWTIAVYFLTVHHTDPNPWHWLTAEQWQQLSRPTVQHKIQQLAAQADLL